MESDLNIVLVSNGPGELATWVRPLMRELRQVLPSARVVIALVPCPHSSGQEQKYARSLHGAYTMSPEDTLHYLITGNLPKGLALARQGVILQLGGDTLFGVSLKWRTGFPLAVYTEQWVQWRRQVNRFYFKTQKHFQKHAPRLKAEQALAVGDLMQSAIPVSSSPLQARSDLQLRTNAPVISFLPGSKPLKVLFSTAFFVSVVDEISLQVPEAQFVLLQSPFTPLSQLREAVQNEKYVQVLGGSKAKIAHDKSGSVMITPQGNKIQIIPPESNYSAMEVSDVSLTLPGTNTAELATLGTPMMVLLPLNRPELLPLDGILQYLHRLPLVGKSLKKTLVLSQLKKMPFLALPNQKAERLLVPEFRGVLHAESIAGEAVDLLQDSIRRREMSRQLRATMPAEQSARRIAEDLRALLEQSYPQTFAQDQASIF